VRRHAAVGGVQRVGQHAVQPEIGRKDKPVVGRQVDGLRMGFLLPVGRK
jgi:hypothetical protein